MKPLQAYDEEADKKISEMMIRCSLATGHGDTINDLLAELEWQIKELKARAREADAIIERCAQLIDEGVDRPGIEIKQDTCAHGKFGWEDCEACCAAAIRALKGREAAE